MQCKEKEVILKKKASFYFNSNLKCHVKLKPTGFINGRFVSDFTEDGSFFMFEDIRKPDSPYRLFIEEIFDIKDYEEVIE